MAESYTKFWLRQFHPSLLIRHPINASSEPSPSFQFPLSKLLAAPLVVSPLFVGLSMGGQLMDSDAWLRIALILLLYVSVFCWIAIRHMDRVHDIRRFPFRGSLLLGISAGLIAAIQFALGFLVSTLWETGIVATFENPILVRALAETGWFTVFMGGLTGAYFGMIAGAIYCLIRHLAPDHSQVIAPSQRRRRRL